ncbi:MAG TPA: TolC family protein, partial [Candidatus Saccharimonadales bacterium]|nr:TolC family protein [Candidatus Saccharimonadales bacterium]
NRPDVKAAAADVRRAEADVSLQRALRVPDPTVQLQYEHEPPDQPHTIGVGVSFPLPLWNRNHAGISASNAAKRQAEANAARTTAAAAAEITIARHDLESALSRREDYERTIVPQSSSIRETVTFAYQKGGASLLDLLTAQRNDNEVRLNAAQAAADVIVARAALASALNEKP